MPAEVLVMRVAVAVSITVMPPTLCTPHEPVE